VTPAEHYAEAERLLDSADETAAGGWASVHYVVGAALVHATLALYSQPVAHREPTVSPPAAMTDREAAEMLEAHAIGDEGRAKQRTVDLLVARSHPDGRGIALEAIKAVRQSAGTYTVIANRIQAAAAQLGLT